jgi:hypothetical protein
MAFAGEREADDVTDMAVVVDDEDLGHGGS